MSESTYVHFYSPSLVSLDAMAIGKVLDTLGVRETVKVTRATQGLTEWDDFIGGRQEWIPNEITARRVTPNEAGSYYDTKKYISIDCVNGHPEDRRAQLGSLIHNHFPAELQRDFYINNLNVKVGLHDVFETIEKPSGELFARTNFSVAFWGYRHPESLMEFREFLTDSPFMQAVRSDLAAVTKSAIDYRIYIT